MFWSKCGICLKKIENEIDSIAIEIRERKMSYKERLKFEICNICFYRLSAIIKAMRNKRNAIVELDNLEKFFNEFI